VEASVLAGERMMMGNDHSRMIITGGNVRVFPEKGQYPVSPSGVPLCCLTPPEDHFEKACQDSRASWTYVADRNADGQLCVWLPQAE